MSHTRARDLGIVIGEGAPGPLNAITDVAGVRVGHATLVSGDGPLVVGQGPVRTGVTVVVPHDGDVWAEPLFAGAATLNGNGELTGLEWVRESGLLSGPIGITNTNDVGKVRDALTSAAAASHDAGAQYWCLPVAGETYDGHLNDIAGGHVRAEHVAAAFAAASGGHVDEGNVGGGTGIVAIFVVGGALAAVGAYWFYRGFETVAPDTESRGRYAWLIFLFPSFTFWSVLLGKDVYIIFFMGLTTLMFARLVERIGVLRLVGFGLALLMVTFLRPHIGAVLGLGAVVALVLRPLPISGPTLYLKPLIRAAIAGGVALVFLQVARRTFSAIGVTSLTVEALAERAFETHQGFATTGGGAALELALASASPWDLAKFLPFGVFTLLFRPFVWEAHNAIALVTALENVVFTGLVVWRLRSFWYGIRLAKARPFMVYALVAMLAGAVVLCVEWNLGAIVRHRAMVLPFLFMFLALPRERRAPLPEKAA